MRRFDLPAFWLAVSLAALLLLLVVVVVVEAGHEADVTCFSCSDVQSPTDCLTKEQCHLDEVCYTREVEDQTGRKGFRLGCEHRSVCQVVETAHILGRRESSLCFQCCSEDSCNKKLCLDAVGHPSSGHAVAESTQYTVIVQTGDSTVMSEYQDAPTNADVYITLYGSLGSSGSIQLVNPGQKSFQIGSEDRFIINVPGHLGSLTKIRVQLMGPHHDDGWFLNKIEVENMGTHETKVFTFYTWLDSDDSGRITSRTVCVDN